MFVHRNRYCCRRRRRRPCAQRIMYIGNNVPIHVALVYTQTYLPGTRNLPTYRRTDDFYTTATTAATTETGKPATQRYASVV